MDGSGSRGQRLLGSLGIVGGLGMIAGFLPVFPWDSPPVIVLRLVLFNAGAAAAVVAVHGIAAATGDRRFLAVAVPTILANAAYLVLVVLSIGRPQFPVPDPGFRPLLFYAAIALWLSDAAFGIAAARVRGVSPWAALAVGFGSLFALTGVGGLGIATGPLAAVVGPISLAGIGVLGIGWVVLGINIAIGAHAAPGARRPAH